MQKISYRINSPFLLFKLKSAYRNAICEINDKDLGVVYADWSSWGATPVLSVYWEKGGEWIYYNLNLMDGDGSEKPDDFNDESKYGLLTKAGIFK